ncbi:hypothetical protein BH10ACI2_BH10ACI2_00340 [soil metagenome]
MTEFTQIIAEVEGIRTPKKNRTRKDIEQAFESFTAKKAAKKTKPAEEISGKQIVSSKALRDRKKAEAEKASKPAAERPTSAEPFPLNFISATGYVREAGFDPKTNTFYVAFAKSTWARPSTQEKWDAFEKAVADPLTDIDQHYRQNFKGTADMIPVRKGKEVSA